ncbi:MULTISPECIES: acetone carboxylase subunit gamma [Burkholderia]|uniref:Acetone carboxylase, gamma subunit n=1 Tax=Burkholderia singularis TaxID=1503053 RepID=A0A238H9F6_9BURK|nr:MULTISPECIES: acetone carboxylase subunit gamma [Burkholderia]ALV54786.1 acetone carboxylase subunit gamma [Burkholderia cenocepacia]AQQ48508.1 acetone carboxylase subunit gamma [Burkholderia cenocepacia]MBA9902181.1 acetone carboxylase subunit gamma [Burkholderia cepacia]MBA9949115.1 acetone carboxylase subunit gamma [Burkholderia cepacia]MBA9979393.1 acetone carboxylase subunit gamma [Burkholderia cepacia]
MSTYTKEQIRNLVDGKLDWDTTLRMLSMPKDGERFQMYVDALQQKLGWKDRIVLPLGPHLYIVQQWATKKWVTQCDCGHVFGDYRENWKLNANIFVRDSEEAMDEVYPRLMAPDTQWQVYREYYCPTCGAMHDVEAPTPWYPVIHDFEPDIDAFYAEWVKLPIPERAE